MKKNLISEEEIMSFSIEKNVEKYEIYFQKIKFFDGRKIYLSWLNEIANQESFYTIPIQISGYDNKNIDLSYLKICSGEEIKIDAYSIILNYRTLLKKFNIMSDEVSNTIIQNINDCGFFGNFFTIFLLVSHTILFGICFFMIKLYENIVLSYLSDIHEKKNDFIT